MVEKWDLVIRQEPYWLMEAMLCMNGVYYLDSEEWLDESSGRRRQEKEQLLAPYRCYRDAMRKELRPVFERYPMVMKYVDPRLCKPESLNEQESPMIEFLRLMQETLEEECRPDDETLKTRIHESFGQMLRKSSGGKSDEDDPVIRDLMDVMEALEHWERSDGDKLMVIRLYSESLILVDQLRELSQACRQAGQRCLSCLRTRYERYTASVRQPKAIENLIQEEGIARWDGPARGIVYPAILRFDNINVQADWETDQVLKIQIYMGIEVFELLQEKRESPDDDESLLRALKAAGDPTRLKILSLLAERSSYLQELAKALRLTPATVSHHMGILLDAGLIALQVQPGRKKVYYQLEKEVLEDMGRKISRLAQAGAGQRTDR